MRTRRGQALAAMVIAMSLAGCSVQPSMDSDHASIEGAPNATATPEAPEQPQSPVETGEPAIVPIDAPVRIDADCASLVSVNDVETLLGEQLVPANDGDDFDPVIAPDTAAAISDGALRCVWKSADPHEGSASVYRDNFRLAVWATTVAPEERGHRPGQVDYWMIDPEPLEQFDDGRTRCSTDASASTAPLRCTWSIFHEDLWVLITMAPFPEWDTETDVSINDSVVQRRMIPYQGGLAESTVDDIVAALLDAERTVIAAQAPLATCDVFAQAPSLSDAVGGISLVIDVGTPNPESPRSGHVSEGAGISHLAVHRRGWTRCLMYAEDNHPVSLSVAQDGAYWLSQHRPTAISEPDSNLDCDEASTPQSPSCTVTLRVGSDVIIAQMYATAGIDRVAAIAQTASTVVRDARASR